jgi:hypothetical protein
MRASPEKAKGIAGFFSGLKKMEKEDGADRILRSDVSILFFYHSVHRDFPDTAERLAFEGGLPAP